MRTVFKVILIIATLFLLMGCVISDWRGMHMDSPFIWIEAKESAVKNLDARWKYTLYTYSTDRFGNTKRNYWFIWSDYSFDLGVYPLKDIFEGRKVVYYEN